MFLYLYLYTSVFFFYYEMEFQLKFCMIILKAKKLHNAYISISIVVTLSKCPLTEGPVSSPQNGHQYTQSRSGTLLSSTACSRTSAMICSSHLEQKYTDYWWYLVHFLYYYQIALVSGFNLESCVMWNHSLHMHIHIIIYVYMHNDWHIENFAQNVHKPHGNEEEERKMKRETMTNTFR